MTDWKARRKAMGITQAELARRCGYTRAYVCNVENGVWKPSEKMAGIMNKVLRGEFRARPREGGSNHIPIVPFRDKAEKKQFHELWCKRQGN